MSALMPANVPQIDDVRYAGSNKVQASPSQVTALRGGLMAEFLEPADLFGDGFTSLEALSKWAAHWGLTIIQARLEARYIEDQRQAVEEYKEQRMKGMIAQLLRENMRRNAE